MAKAGVELPDPLLSPADAAPPLTSTDDLLAQLAGEEIDRLLAEVDDQSGSAAAAPAAPARADAAPSRPIEFSGTPDAAPPAPSEPPKFDDDADPPAAVAAVAAAAEPDVTAELDAFFKTAAKAPEPVAAQMPSSRAPTSDATGHDLAETSAAERAGLNAPVSGAGLSASTNAPAASTNAPAAAAEAIKERAAGPAVVATDDGPLPLYLKPLEWINAPLEACPSALRDFIGKAAIITLVNAAAVLLYVMLFRRR